MTPPLFQMVKSDPFLLSMIGSNPVRFYLFGEAPQGVVDPYVVWQQISGQPENYLADAPNLDSFSIQFDVYGTSAKQVRQVAEALRDCLEVSETNAENGGYVVSWRGETRDPATMRYRSSFDMDFITYR